MRKAQPLTPVNVVNSDVREAASTHHLKTSPISPIVVHCVIVLLMNENRMDGLFKTCCHCMLGNMTLKISFSLDMYLNNKASY
ncbi:MAG: hypothetical protein ACHQYP_02605 [Nitrospiria bacterium]